MEHKPIELNKLVIGTGIRKKKEDELIMEEEQLESL